MKDWLLVAAAILVLLVSLLFTTTTVSGERKAAAQSESNRQELNNQVRRYLESNESPLAQETDYLLQQKHWKLLIAISAIESQYCKRQLGLNCWGITSVSGGYRKYDSLQTGIKDANDLIERWQAKGRWLSVEDFNCHYVVPCNDNWVRVVTSVLEKLDAYERSTGAVP